MCQKCFDNMKELFPDMPEEEYVDYLMNYTSFPFGSAEEIRGHLEHIKEVGLEQSEKEVWDEMEKLMRIKDEP